MSFLKSYLTKWLKSGVVNIMLSIFNLLIYLLTFTLTEIDIYREIKYFWISKCNIFLCCGS